MAGDSQADFATPIPRAGRGRKRNRSIPFWALMFFTFILFIAPQTFIPILRPFRIAMLSAGLALVVYVTDRLLHQQPLTVAPPAVQLIFCFTLLAGLSIPFSLWPGGSFDAFFNELLKSVLIFALVANVVNTVRRMKLIISSMALWTTTMAWTAVHDFSEGNLALQGVRISGYDSPLAANPNDLALILNLILALTIGLYSTVRKPLAKICLLGVMTLSVGGVISSFSRGGFLTLATIAILWLIKRTRERGPTVLLCALAAVPLVVFLLPEGYGHRLYSIFDSSADLTGSSEARKESMVLAWKAIVAYPVLGTGLRQHGVAFIALIGWKNWSGAHNVYLEIAADLGIPALLIYLGAIWSLLTALKQCLRKLKRSRGKVSREARDLAALGSGIEIALVAFLVAAFFHPVSYYFYFYYIAGLSVAFQTMADRAVSPTHGAPTVPRLAVSSP